MGSVYGGQSWEPANVEQANENRRVPDDNTGNVIGWVSRNFADIADRLWLRRRQGIDIYDDVKSDGTAETLNDDVQTGLPDINQRYPHPDGRTPLTAAIRNNDLAGVQQILQHPGIQTDFCEVSFVSGRDYRIPPVIVATKEKKYDILQAILEAGANVYAQDSLRHNALYYAAEDRDEEAVAILLKYRTKGIDYRHAHGLAYSQHNCDPLHQACRYGHLGVVRRLVAFGYSVNPIKEEEEVSTPLNAAITSKNEDLCLFLVQNGAEFKGLSNYDNSTFLNACRHGCSRIVQYYIAHGVSFPMEGQQSLAFYYAARHGDLERLARQAKLKQTTGIPLQECLIDMNKLLLESITVMELLCKAGGCIDSLSNDHQLTPLGFSLYAKNIPASIVLLKHGAQWDNTCDHMFEKRQIRRLKDCSQGLYDFLIYMLDNIRRDMFRPRDSFSEVQSLKDCCRKTIRNCVVGRTQDKAKRTSIMPTLEALPLPVRLRDFLCYNDVQLDYFMRQSHESHNALYYAAEDRDEEAVAILLKYRTKGIDYRHAHGLAYSQHNCDPLHQACRYGHLGVVRRLVAFGYSVNPIKEEEEVSTPLNAAITSKNEDLCLFLVQNGAEFKGLSNYDNSTFLNACRHGCSRIVQYYIAHGVSFPMEGQQSLAFYYAARHGDLERLARQAKLKQTTGIPLQECLIDMNKLLLESITVMELLCKAGGCIDSLSNDHQLTPLGFSLYAKNIPASIVLLKHGAQWDNTCDHMFEKRQIRRLKDCSQGLYDFLIYMLDNIRRDMFRPRDSFSEVQSLKDCCRKTIRNCVVGRTQDKAKRTSIMPTLEALPLPVRLRDFLCYNDVQLDYFMRQSHESYIDYLISCV